MTYSGDTAPINVCTNINNDSDSDFSGVDLNVLFKDSEKEDEQIGTPLTTLRLEESKEDTVSDTINGEDGEDGELKQKRNEYIVPGLSGLRNIGNTCYMNATLQCLASLQPLNSYMRNYKFQKRLKDNVTEKMAKAYILKNKLPENSEVNLVESNIDNLCHNSISFQLGRLLKYMWKENCSISPKTLKTVIGKTNSEFEGFGQNDSQELINLLLDRIHEETKAFVSVEFCDVPESVTELIDLKKKCMEIKQNKNSTLEEKTRIYSIWNEFKSTHRDTVIVLDAYVYWKKYIKDSHSIITDLFTGLFYSEVICSSCNHKSTSFEPFTVLSVETAQDGETTLEKCLNDFSNLENMTGDNMYNCDRCKIKVDATKKLYIWEPPEILIVHLKRFKTEYISPKYSKTSKTSSKVVFPMDGLSLDNNYSPLQIKNNGVTYKLWSIVLHKGNCNCGHYIAYCRNPVNKLWYEFNDDTVIHVPDETIEKEVITENAYVMFYVRDR